jgi:hypothetical protein
MTLDIDHFLTRRKPERLTLTSSRKSKSSALPPQLSKLRLINAAFHSFSSGNVYFRAAISIFERLFQFSDSPSRLDYIWTMQMADEANDDYQLSFNALHLAGADHGRSGRDSASLDHDREAPERTGETQSGGGTANAAVHPRRRTRIPEREETVTVTRTTGLFATRSS